MIQQHPASHAEDEEWDDGCEKSNFVVFYLDLRIHLNGGRPYRKRSLEGGEASRIARIAVRPLTQNKGLMISIQPAFSPHFMLSSKTISVV